MAPEARVGNVHELMFEGKHANAKTAQNPYVAGGHVSPPAGRRYADRARRAPGMIHAGDASCGRSPPPAGAGAAPGARPPTTSTSPPAGADLDASACAWAAGRRRMAAPVPSEECQMSSTETRPADADADVGEDDGYAHYARKDEIARAAVLGGLITALCG
jgi:hypothetical protein